MTTYTTINGTKYDNTLIGSDPNTNYLINGRNGDDVIVGNMLEDILHGNAGDDYVYGDTQFLVVRIVLPDYVDFVLPLQDMTVSLGANDVITGNADNDHLYGDMGLIDSIYQMGNITVTDGQSASSSIILSNLHWTFGHDKIDGDSGDDVIHGDHGEFINKARLGSTTATGVGSTAISQLTAPNEVKLVWGNDELHGGSGNDLIYGDMSYMEIEYLPSQAHAISGGTAISNNISEGESYNYGHDYIKGGSGNDVIYGDMRYIDITFSGKTAIVDGGGLADARLVLENYQSLMGQDVIEGGDGDDLIFGDQEYEIDRISGGYAYADGGHATADVLYNNVKLAMGNDDISGGSGDDKIYADSIMFTLQVAQGTAVAVNGGIASATGSIQNTNVVMGNDLIRGGSGNDVIFADTCKVILPGDELTSSVVNIDGVNYVRAFDNKNNGVIWGNDTIHGGSGIDTMVFNLFHTQDDKLGMQGFDTIHNFNKNYDVLSFGDVLDITGNGQVDLNDLLASTSVLQQGNNTVVNFNGGGSLTFVNTQFSSLAALSNVDVSCDTVMA